MPARRPQGPPHRPGLRWIAGALTLGAVGAAAGSAILAAVPAGAAPSPTYHAGSDTATFSATGVLDSNCVVSAGGTELWIKPGDTINFKSALAGINVASAGLTTYKVAGLNVDASIGTKPNTQSFTVSAGHTTVIPKAGQAALSAGDHTLHWTAKSVSAQLDLALGLGPVITVPLNSGELKSGASLSWSGVIHVTNDAPKCKLGVSTPKVGVSVGPIKVTVPPVNVAVPVPTLPKLPKVPKLPGGATAPGGGTKTTPARFNYTPPALTVPERAMGGIGGGIGLGYGGGSGGVAPDAGGSTQLATGLPERAGGNPANSTAATSPAGTAQSSTKPVDLAAKKSPAAGVPLLLAIVAIIGLAFVTASYIRLRLVRRSA